MTFEKFKSNVEQWAEARGIYKHSTALAQALKAVSEVGELSDAVIKGDKDALKDAIGDVAVCLINAAKLLGVDVSLDSHAEFHSSSCSKERAALCAFFVSDIASSIVLGSAAWSIEDAMEYSFSQLIRTAEVSDLNFMDCCEAAWQVIKNRKGKMVAGGAFVKDE